jgi:hypothetical protein
MTEQDGATAPKSSHQFQNQISCLRSLLKFLLVVATGPYRRTFKLYTWKPIQEIRAANGDRKVLIPLIKDWKLDKYAEFKSAQVTVSQAMFYTTKLQPNSELTISTQATFCGGAVLSSLPLARSEDAIWIVNALWYCSLVCSIFAIVTSIQTVSMVDDLPSCEQLNEFLPETDVQRMQQTILRYKKTPGIKHWVMMFIWQFPSMTMAYAWLTYVAGLTVFLCSPFIKNLPWQGQHKVDHPEPWKASATNSDRSPLRTFRVLSLVSSPMFPQSYLSTLARKSTSDLPPTLVLALAPVRKLALLVIGIPIRMKGQRERLLTRLGLVRIQRETPQAQRLWMRFVLWRHCGQRCSLASKARRQLQETLRGLEDHCCTDKAIWSAALL